MPFPCEAGEAEGEPDVAPAPGKSLEMENARLRAEIATQYAMEAARSLAGEGTPRETALPLSASQRSLQGRSDQLGSEVCPLLRSMSGELFSSVLELLQLGLCCALKQMASKACHWGRGLCMRCFISCKVMCMPGWLYFCT